MSGSDFSGLSSSEEELDSKRLKSGNYSNKKPGGKCSFEYKDGKANNSTNSSTDEEELELLKKKHAAEEKALEAELTALQNKYDATRLEVARLQIHTHTLEKVRETFEKEGEKAVGHMNDVVNAAGYFAMNGDKLFAAVTSYIEALKPSKK